MSEEDAKLAATGTRTRVLHAEVHCFQQLFDLDTARGAHVRVGQPPARALLMPLLLLLLLPVRPSHTPSLPPPPSPRAHL